MLRNDEEEARTDKQNDHRDNEARKYNNKDKGTTKRYKITTKTPNY